MPRQEVAFPEKSITMKTRRIYDVSLPVYLGMLVWPGNPPVAIDYVKSIAQGASINVSLLHIGSHSGTHVDAPRHFIDGAPARVFLREL